MIRKILCVVLIAALGVLCACSAAPQQNTAAPDAEGTQTASAEDTADAAELAETAGADSEQNEDEAHKALVAYFSNTGNTQRAAQSIAESLDAVLFEIEPVEPYTEADTATDNDSARAAAEQGDDTARPAIKPGPEDIRQYDVVYLGYPIWWNSAPRVIYTFLDENNLAGMKVVPFCTSGGSGIENSENELKAAFPDIDWQAGERIMGSEVKMAEWTDELGFWPFGDV